MVKERGITYIKDEIFNGAKFPGAVGELVNLGPDFIRLTDTTGEMNFDFDAFVFCLTRNPTKEMMLNFDCNACFEITNVRKFCAELGLKMYLNGHTSSPKFEIKGCIYLFPSQQFPLNSFREQTRTLLRK